VPENEILVVGSLNYDLFLVQDRLAERGETLTAHGLREAFGGKGGNQAVQAARLGAPVSFLGAIGSDERGEAYRRSLENEGIACHVASSKEPTGLGVVNVLPGGEVHCTIVEGANGIVDGAYVRAHADVFADAGYVVLQNEIPASGNAAATALARAAGAVVVYNAAPARPGSDEIACDYLIVNEEEAQALTGTSASTLDDWCLLAGRLAAAGPGVIVTLGSFGAAVCLDGTTAHLAASPAQAVDTTGAGDSFVGAFVAALREGRDPLGAATLAGRIAGVTTEGVGAQTSMPRDWR